VGLVAGARDVVLEAIEVVAGVEAVDPVELRVFRVPPRAVRALARTAVFHRLRGNRAVLRVACQLPHAAQETGAEHVGVVDRALSDRVIAQAGAAAGPLARQRQDPAARALGHAEILRDAGAFVAVDERVPDERGPDDDRFVLAVTAAAAR